MVYYQLPGQNTIQRLDVSGGVTQSGIDYKIIPIGSDDSGLQEYSLTLPSYTRAEGVRFILYQPSHHGVGYDNYGITQINYRRVKPIAVFVSLDSPEASSFMRLGSSPSTLNKSKKEREKELREQLEASKDYTDKKFGENFPGSETPAPGEEDPTEQAKRAPGLGEFEPEVVDYNSWKQDTEKEDPQAKTSKADYTKWKDEKLLKSFANVRDKQLLTPTDQASETPAGKSFDDMKMDQQPKPEPSDSRLASFSTSAKSSTPIGGESGVGAVLGADADNLRRETPPKVPAAQEKFEKDFETGTENIEKELEKGEEQFTMSDKEKEKLKDQGFSDEEIKKDEESQKKSWLDQQKQKVGNFILDKGLDFFKSIDPLDAPVDAVLNLFSGVVNTFNTIGNLVGFTGYEKMLNNIEIMRSTLTGRITPYNFGSTQMRDLADSITPTTLISLEGFTPYAKDSGITYGISDERHEYADDLIKVVNGKISRNDVAGGNRTHQPLANMGTGVSSVDGIGKGYGQMIIPKDGGMPYFHFYDYNYNNLNSPDAAEVPGLINNIGATIANNLRRIMPGRLVDDKINELQGNIDTFGNNLKERVGLDGWPPGVHGATLTDFKIPLNKLPTETQAFIEKHPLYFDRKVDGLSTDSNEFLDLELKTFEDALDNNPEKANESIEKMIAGTEEQFPEMAELQERNKVAREEFDKEKEKATTDLGPALKERVDLAKYMGFNRGNSDYKGTLEDYMRGTIDKVAAQDIAKVSGVDLGEVDKLMKDYDLGARNKFFVDGKFKEGVDSDHTWARSQPEYKEAEAAWNDAKKATAAAYEPYKKALDVAAAFENSLPRHPTKKNYVTGTPDQIAKLRRLSAELAPLRSAYDKTEAEEQKYIYEPGIISGKLVKERRDADDKVTKISDDAEKNIAKLYKEAGDVVDELNTLATSRFEPERLPPELESAMRRWMLKFFNTSFQGISGESWTPGNTPGLPGGTGPSEDPFSPPLTPPEGYPDPTTDPDAYQDFNVSGGTEVAGAGGSPGQPYTPPQEDPTNPYVPAPGRGTQVASTGTGGSPYQDFKDTTKGKKYTKPPSNIRDLFKNIPKADNQQDFGTLAGFYGGQGVDAATLASTAAATQTKKKKKKTTTNLPSIPTLTRASYKPQGSMITEKRKLKSPNDWFNPDDIKPEYPKDPPPEMVNNYHPDLVDSAKKAERFNKLDPASAKAMPKQDDPNIDAKVEKAKNNPDKDGPGWHKQVSDKIRMARAQQRKG